MKGLMPASIKDINNNCVNSMGDNVYKHTHE